MHRGIRKSAMLLAAALTIGATAEFADAVLLVPASLMRSANAAASLTVDASAVVSDTGGNDLTAARNLFQSASYPESNGGLETSWPLLSGISTRYSRVINTEGGSVLDPAGNIAPSDRVNWNYPWVKRYNLNPHVIVGQWHPNHLPWPAKDWTPDIWVKYQDYADKFVRYTVAQYDSTGFYTTLFEVGNEVDITPNSADLWTAVDNFAPQGHEERYQHYMRVYRVWSRAVARIAAEYPMRKVQIGGPAMGGQSLFLTNTFWHERFVRDVAAEGLRLDVLTHHFYGDVLNGWPNVPGSALKAQLQRMRQALVANGRAATPISITEYGPTEANDAVFGKISYTHESAAWAMMFMTEALAGTATSGSYLLVRDNFGPDQTGVPGVASLIHFRNGVDYPKAVYNAFRMWWMLPGGRKAVTASPTQPNVRSVASASVDAAAVIVYNYDFKYNWPTSQYDASVAEPVTPGFTNLAFTGDVLVERYLIDAQTSNVARYLDAGQAPDLAGSSLTRVEWCYAKVQGGSVVLPQRTLGPSAVSMWVLKSKFSKPTAEVLASRACA
jgi:hypothetical protein